MLKYIDFQSPNTMGNGMNYHYSSLFVKRTGLCPDNVISPCIHANIVQTDWSNPTIDTHSIESLLKRMEDEWKIDLNKLYYKKGGEVQFMTYDFVRRKSFRN